MARAKLTLLVLARKDLIEIRRYSLREFGLGTADRYVDDIRGAFQLLLDTPGAGAERGDIAPGIRSFTKRGHPIFYRVGSEGIAVVRILHHSQDVTRHLEP